MASLAGLAVFATGCGANEPENIGSSQAAFTVDSCAVATADQTFEGKIDPAVVSPRSYYTCYKGYVVDILNLDPYYTGEGNASDARISVAYAETPITDQATCEGLVLTAVFYEFGATGLTSTATGSGGDWGWIPITSEARRGEWFQGGCHIGAGLTGMVPGGSYRVAATVRTPSNATRRVSIGTDKPINIQ